MKVLEHLFSFEIGQTQTRVLNCGAVITVVLTQVVPASESKNRAKTYHFNVEGCGLIKAIAVPENASNGIMCTVKSKYSETSVKRTQAPFIDSVFSTLARYIMDNKQEEYAYYLVHHKWTAGKSGTDQDNVQVIRAISNSLAIETIIRQKLDDLDMTIDDYYDIAGLKEADIETVEDLFDKNTMHWGEGKLCIVKITEIQPDDYDRVGKYFETIDQRCF